MLETGTKRRDENRIGFLDGFRGVAILVVIAFHYYSRFADDPRGMYPFGDVWSGFFLFEYGYYGVHLFFAVSGFVISLTLIRCRSMVEFIVRRFARLWPTMVVCALITFCFLSLFPTYWPQQPQNFLPSLTFIPGDLYQRAIPDIDFAFIDGAYWSLFVEVRFYALAAMVYFVNPQSFVRNFIGFSIIVLAAESILEHLGLGTLTSILRLAFIPDYLPWFLLGIGAHSLTLEKRRSAAACAAVSLTALVVGGIESRGWGDFVVSIIVINSFLACIFLDRIRRLFSAKWLTRIGVASYSLYLLHQFIGVTATASISSAFALSPREALVAPILMASILILVSGVIYRCWETPLNNTIVEAFMRRRVGARVDARPVR
jgi:peptidoglycan/LPS O-acetylase OafA/YrhL